MRFKKAGACLLRQARGVSIDRVLSLIAVEELDHHERMRPTAIARLHKCENLSGFISMQLCDGASTSHTLYKQAT